MLERAFELARTGEYSNLGDLSKQLRSEGFNLAQLEGDSLKRQLRAICAAARRS
jgi:hypothetical protein